MKAPISRDWLFAQLSTPNAVPVTINGITGTVSNVEREDGSGRSFNVTLNTPKGKATTHVRAA